MPQPWERRNGESAEAYRAFLVYRDQGADRSLSAVSVALRGQAPSEPQTGPEIRPRRKAGNVGGWSRRHDWVERVEAWDTHLQERRDTLRIKRFERWERKRLDALEKVWEDAQELRVRGRALLRLPHVRREVAETDPQTRAPVKVVFHPVNRGAFREAAIMLSEAAEMEAAACAAVALDPPEGYVPDPLVLLGEESL